MAEKKKTTKAKSKKTTSAKTKTKKEIKKIVETEKTYSFEELAEMFGQKITIKKARELFKKF